MAGKWNGKRCSSCGEGTLHDDVRERTHDYRGETFRAAYKGAYCDHCSDGMVYHDSELDDQWEAFCKDVDDSQRRELASIRRRLKLTQEEAAKLSGGGHNAFSRYERGEAQPVMAVIELFRLFDRYPALLEEVRGRAEPGSLYVLPVIAGRGAHETIHTLDLSIDAEQSAANDWQSQNAVATLKLDAA